MNQYKPIEIANTLIEKFGAAEGGIDHMKLQKLVYCVHGWWLAYFPDKPLLKEKPEVWKFGPVFPSMYHELKVYGLKRISTPVQTSPFEAPPLVDEKDAKTISLLEWVWKRYGHMSGMELSDMTHKEGTAWKAVAIEHNFFVPKGFFIADRYIIDEFTKIKDAFEVAPQ
jgi:uncharacterized phage-associated protein